MAVIQTTDDAFIVAGSTSANDNGDIWLAKVLDDDQVEWQATYGGTSSDGASSVIEVSDGSVTAGYLVTGTTTSFGATDSESLVLLVNREGEARWTRLLSTSSNDAAHSAIQTSDLGLVVVGGGVLGVGGHDMYAMKLDLSGNMIWQMAYGGSFHDLAYAIAETASGLAIAGVSQSFPGGLDAIFLLRTDYQGAIEPGCSATTATSVEPSEVNVNQRSIDLAMGPTSAAIVDTSVTSALEDLTPTSECSVSQ